MTNSQRRKSLVSSQNLISEDSEEDQDCKSFRYSPEVRLFRLYDFPGMVIIQSFRSLSDSILGVKYNVLYQLFEFYGFTVYHETNCLFTKIGL